MKPLTAKQRQLLKVIVLGNLDATGARVSDVDYQQMLNRIPYKTSRDSLMCSIAILEKQGWLVKAGKENRDGRMKQTLSPTPQCIRVMNPPKPSAVPEYFEIDVDDDDVVLLELS